MAKKIKIPASISKLKETEYNPRVISDSALQGLRISLKKFGDLSGIVYNTKLDSLVAGHQRVKGLIAEFGDLNITQTDNGWRIITPSGEVFPIRVVSWDKKMHDSALVAANAISIQGENTEGIYVLLDEIKIEMPDIFEGLQLASLQDQIIGYEDEGEKGTDENANLLDRRTGEGVIFEVLMSDQNKKFIISVIKKLMEKKKLETIEQALVGMCKMVDKAL